MVVFDTRLLRESRQMETDFVNQLDVYCRRPRQWESFVEMTGMLEANQLEYGSILCEKELKRSGFDVECAMLGASPWKIRSLDVFGARRMVSTQPRLDCRIRCLKYAKKRTVGKTIGDMCSSITKQSHGQSCVVVSCVGSCTDVALASSRVIMCN